MAPELQSCSSWLKKSRLHRTCGARSICKHVLLVGAKQNSFRCARVEMEDTLSDIAMDNAFADRMGFRSGDHRAPVTFLPEPSPRTGQFTVVSVDDHVVEPPDIFDGRLPMKHREAAPRIVEDDDGAQMWLFDDGYNRNIGLSAVVGRPRSDYDMQPTRFEHMRRGCYNADARVADMDVAAIAASVNFPNALPGFAGTRFAEAKDEELGLALVRAWNDWLLEEWVEPHPMRFIPCQLTWINDVEIAESEVHRNAERGFRAVSFPEAPQKLGRPSLHSGYWDPFLRACEETGTVVCLHVGSSSSISITAEDAPAETIPILFPVSAIFAAVDWLYSRVPVRFPDIKIALSEGGISWIPGLIDRLDHSWRHRPYFDRSWSKDGSATPVDVFLRNFWFCAIDDPSGYEQRYNIGVSHIMVESDYPHADSTWPDTQSLLESHLSGVPEFEAAQITHLNACELFRHHV